jgi:hypothetical protein
LFRSFFLGGFECSTHVRKDGRRLDLIASTHHDLLAEEDYRQVAEHGIRAVRDGVRWHLVQAAGPGQYDWAPVLPLLRAAARTGTQVVWISATMAGRTGWISSPPISRSISPTMPSPSPSSARRRPARRPPSAR